MAYVAALEIPDGAASFPIGNRRVNTYGCVRRPIGSTWSIAEMKSTAEPAERSRILLCNPWEAKYMGLRDKYAYAISQAKGKFDGGAEERDGKLYFTGSVKTENEKNEIWSAIKTIPDWKDEIVADIKVTGGPAAAAAKTYTVKAGDTLSAIAKAEWAAQTLHEDLRAIAISEDLPTRSSRSGGQIRLRTLRPEGPELRVLSDPGPGPVGRGGRRRARAGSEGVIYSPRSRTAGAPGSGFSATATASRRARPSDQREWRPSNHVIPVSHCEAAFRRAADRGTVHSVRRRDDIDTPRMMAGSWSWKAQSGSGRQWQTGARAPECRIHPCVISDLMMPVMDAGSSARSRCGRVARVDSGHRSVGAGKDRIAGTS